MPVRSIPAYAGDPMPTLKPPPKATVYPRLRGGSTLTAYASPPVEGLSPPTRGIRGGCGCGVPKQGSIPAYAGDPHRGHHPRRYTEVYPRLRGGSAPNTTPAVIGEGLSPPTRGIRPAARRNLP